MNRMANRSLDRMDSDIRRNKEILAVLPQWQNEFRRLCGRKMEEIDDVEELRPAGIVKTRPELSKKESVHDRLARGSRRGVSVQPLTTRRKQAYGQGSSQFSLFFKGQKSPVVHYRH